MIDIKQIRLQPDLYRQALKKKRMELDLDLLLALDTRCRIMQAQVDELRKKRNEISEATRVVAPGERERHLAAAKELSEELDQLEAAMREAQTQLRQMLLH